MEHALTGTTPRIIVADGFYEKPDEVRLAALGSELMAHPEYHKGYRSTDVPIPEAVQRYFERMLGKKFVKAGKRCAPYRCYQLCVAGDQIVYHSELQSHAAVVFLGLDAPVESGTSFFRSRETGVSAGPTEKDAARLGVDLDELCQKTYDGKLLDRTAWEEVDRVGNVYNRMAIWDASMIHGASCYFGTAPENGRLFEMFFFDME